MIEPSLEMMAGALFELIALARVHEYTSVPKGPVDLLRFERLRGALWAEPSVPLLPEVDYWEKLAFLRIPFCDPGRGFAQFPRLGGGFHCDPCM